MNNISPAEFAKAAALAHAVAEQMMARLEWMAIKPQTILDVGCGVGWGTHLLQQRYPEARVMGVDTAKALLQFAEQTYPNTAQWICAEAGQIPLPERSVDLVFANLVLPWCSDSDVETMLREWLRVLRPNGLLMLSSLGPDTLREWPDRHLLLPQMMDMHNVGDALLQVGFLDPVLDVDYLTLTYREQAALLRELYVTSMLESDQMPVALTKNVDGVFALTYEVVYGHAWRPSIDAGYKMDKSGVVKIPLSHLRKRDNF